jgi:hypothetical protein
MEKGRCRLMRTMGLWIFIMVAALCISGCGKNFWYSTAKDAAAFQQDRFQCEADAATYSANMGNAGKKSLVEKRMIDCMKLRGYVWADESDAPRGAAKFE